ncbi:hypothetical protein H6G33_09085 [Calothrix sp. FACHB-1219]|uniref:hypothetical protein n=1 Tax=unclassified Calothrix TaxID=2619626 RepID=UPI001689E77E|nr:MULTISPECIES: hypothetical protein [unclassified Calothrix]MBD2202151.1 hypothetical protein [Calothrix sp. FACHB-168]MBD2217185.1 hypothetical protein [Calothrix sp. FACHB-1219]
MQLLKSENKKTNILPMFAVGTLGVNILTLFVLMFHGSMLQRLNQQIALPSLVQLIDGRSITANPQENQERYQQTIRHFVGETMTLMLTWSQQLPPNTVWDISSQLVTEDFQPKLQTQINKLNSEKRISSSYQATEQILAIQRISQPEQIAEGKWKVEMIANLLVFHNSDRLGESIPVNQQIFIQTTDEPVASLPQSPTALHLAAYRLGAARLQIYKVCDLKDKTCSEKLP